MADYSKVVAWSGKDSLADSDAAKVISGADFHTEFSAVETAVNTKADINGDASEAFSATTAASGTNTTQVATTAFVQAALTAATINALVYPVGSIYMNANVSTNPATLLGFGTWEAYAEGRVPVGKASSGTFNTLNATGGAETQALTEANLPSHNHNSVHGGSSGSGRPSGFSAVSNSSSPYNFGGGTDDDDWGISTTSSTGSGTAHNNLQPYIVVYMWKRTA
jgi:hypothetical protein